MSRLFIFFFTLGFIFFSRFEGFTFIFQKIIIPLTFLYLLLRNLNIITKIGILSLYILFIIMASTSFVHTINMERTLRFFQLMIGSFMLLFIYVVVLIHNPKLLKTIAYAFILSAILFILTMDMSPENQESDRVMGITSNPNIFGLFMIYAIFGVAFLWKEANKKLRIFLVSVVVLSFYGIISAASRKSMISVGVFLSLWAVLLFVSEKNFLKTSVFVVSIMFVSYFIYNVFYLDSIMMLRFEYAEESGKGRYDIATEGFKLFKSSPLIGVGLGTFQEYSDSGKYAHNDFFELIATLGLFGLIIYVSIYYWLISTINKVKKNVKNKNVIYILNTFIFIIITMIVLGVGRPHFFDTFSMSLFGIMAGYTLGIAFNSDYIDES